MKKTAIGHVDCPVCGFVDAEVKEDKNRQAYIHCTDCNAQTFTRNDFRDRKLRGRMRPVTVTVTEEAAPAAASVTEPEPPAALPPAQTAAPVAPPPPPAPKKKPGWITPLLT